MWVATRSRRPSPSLPAPRMRTSTPVLGHVLRPPNCDVAVSIAKDTSTIALKSSASPAALGTPVTITAVVKGGFPAVPTGQVVFTVDGAALPAVAIDATGAASFNTSTLTLGMHTITASYGGATDFTAPAEDATFVAADCASGDDDDHRVEPESIEPGRKRDLHIDGCDYLRAGRRADRRRHFQRRHSVICDDAGDSQGTGYVRKPRSPRWARERTALRRSTPAMRRLQPASPRFLCSRWTVRLPFLRRDTR